MILLNLTTRNPTKKMPTKKACLQCGSTIVKPYTESVRQFRDRHKFCSRECVSRSLVGRGVKNAVKYEKGRKPESWRHGMSGTRFYSIWYDMRRRCSDPSRSAYPWYGGRGVGVDPLWQDFMAFRDDMYEAYLKHVELFGEKQTTLDRADVNKGYSVDNCRWATLKEQGHNRLCVKCRTQIE